MIFKIVVEKIMDGYCATVRDADENALGSAAMTTKDAAIAKATARALEHVGDDELPVTFEVVDLSASSENYE